MSLSQLAFSQPIHQKYDFQIPLRSTPYRLNIQVRATNKPESNQNIRRPSLMDKLFRSKFTPTHPTIVQQLSIEKTDRVFLSLQHRRIANKQLQLSGELHINYYLSGFDAPRLLVYKIDSMSKVPLDFHTLQQLIMQHNHHHWTGNSVQIRIDKIVWQPETKSPRTTVNYYPHLSIGYKP